MLSAVQMSQGSTVIAHTVTMEFNRRGKNAVTLNRMDNGQISLLERKECIFSLNVFLLRS